MTKRYPTGLSLICREGEPIEQFADFDGKPVTHVNIGTGWIYNNAEWKKRTKRAWNGSRNSIKYSLIDPIHGHMQKHHLRMKYLNKLIYMSPEYDALQARLRNSEHDAFRIYYNKRNRK